MAGKPFEVVLDTVDESRRSFLRSIIAGTAFVTPMVASYRMGGIGVGEAMAQVANQTTRGSGSGKKHGKQPQNATPSSSPSGTKGKKKHANTPPPTRAPPPRHK